MKNWITILTAMLLAVPAFAHEETAANEMAAAANALLATLDAKQKESALYPFDGDHRLDWHFVPKERTGLLLKTMTPEQRLLANALLASGLSSRGLIKANTIMSLEQVLAVMEGPDRRFPRDPELYFISIYGEPAPGKTWGWRFEGHHLSLSFTIVDGKHISATPSFFGTNPGIIKSGPRKGLQTADLEENLGRALVKSLNANQLKKALIDVKAPSDVITLAERKVSPLKNDGIGWRELTGDQKEQLWTLVKVYVERARGEISEVDLLKIQSAGQDNLVFAWAGGLEVGDGHYYRIQGPTFLIEYDNTQNGANHVHAVYRDFEDDFGGDLLKKHYEQSH
jgi:hypothetical protein